MTVQILSAVSNLMTKVTSYFSTYGIDAAVDFGDRALAKQATQGPGRANRVVFCPFDPKSGNAGELGEPELTGPRDVMSGDDPTVRVATVRALFDWRRLFVVSVWAFDATAPESDLAHHVAAEALLNRTVEAIHYAGFTSLAFGAVQVVIQGERRFGAELRVQLTLTHPLYDRPDDVGYPGFQIARAGED